MSILDFTTGLFREPASLQSFVDDPEQALRDAGLPDATPEQVHDLIPVVAESMPADHPLQAVLHAPDPVAALLDLDIAQLTAALRDHGRTDVPDKSMGEPASDQVISVADIECGPIDDDDIVDSAKALDGVVDDPLTQVIEGDLEAAPDDYHALPVEDLADADSSPAAWGKEID
jgi:hypothetical protein